MAAGTLDGDRRTVESATFRAMAAGGDTALVDNGGATTVTGTRALGETGGRYGDDVGGQSPISHDEARRLAVLAKVADAVTADFSLDRQLPQLIELIVE